MHVTLTDVLNCPRCGPGWGLVLLPDEVRERRAWRGFLGCPNCRSRYEIREGVGLLVPEESGEPWRDEAAESEGSGAGSGGGVEAEATAVGLGGRLGLGSGSGVVLLAGWPVAAGAALAGLVEEVEVVMVTAVSAPAVSSIRSGPVLPFRTGGLRAVALRGGAADAWLEEGARVVSPAGRLVVEDGPESGRARVESAGLRVVAEEPRVLVAVRR